MRAVSLVVILLYLIIGSSLIFTKLGSQFVNEPQRLWVGVVIVVYGIYRAIRLYMNTSNVEEE